MIFKTFRGRFVFISATVISLLYIVLGIFIYHSFSGTILEEIDRSLLAAAKGGAAGEDSSDPAVSLELLKIVNNEFYQVITRQGKVTIAYLDSNYPWPVNRKLINSALKGLPQYESANHKGDNYRILYYPIDSDAVLRVRKSQESFDRASSELRRLLLFSFLPLFLISLILGWIFAGRLLDPVRSLKSIAEKIKQGRWEDQPSLESYGKEIDELGRVLNEMAGNIKRSMESQKRFTADVSHEIRSPLTSLRGSVEVALRKKRTPEEYEEVLRNNLSDVIRLTRLTDNLLFLSRADHKILALRRQWFDVKHMLEAVVEGFRDRALQEGVFIQEDYQPELELNGDIELLEQAISNIIDNAIKYTSRGGTVSIKSTGENDAVKITVSDTGVGIPEDQLPHIFERFYRVERKQPRRQGGTGLGLAITHWIVNAHSGDITVNSAIGSGSEFTITLPKMTA